MSFYKERESNIELLRIISMVLVLVFHASYTSLETPTQTEIAASLSYSLLRSLSESLSVVCVNAFILISGWYGIKVRCIRFIELIFQVILISISIYVFFRVRGLTQKMGISEWIELILIKHRGYWFVKAYIILYLFAPVLNTFADNVSRKKLKIFLVAFFIIQLIYGFYHYGSWYAGGYSPLSFMGLYLLARYMRLYPCRFTQFNKYMDLTLYFVISLLTAICSLALTWFFGKGSTVLFLYSSPMVILSSVFFFLFFTKLSLQNQFVNWVASSCFAVYLVHNSPYIFHTYYTGVVKYWFDTEPRSVFLLYCTCLIMGFFLCSVLFDKVRIIVWKSIMVCSHYNNRFRDKVS